MQSLAFPLRLQENGLLRREEKTASLLALLQMMARTPQGSWQACPTFGLRDLFESNRHRADIARLAMERINGSLRDLQITGYVVSEVVRERDGNRETETFAITLENDTGTETLSTVVAYEQ